MTRRIVALVIAVTALSIAAFFVPAALAIRSSQEREELLELQREAAIAAGRVPPFGSIDMSVLRPIVDSEHELALYDRNGTLLGGTGPETPDRLVELGLRGSFAEGYVGESVVAVVPLRLQADGSALVMRIQGPRTGSTGTLVALGAIALAILGVAVGTAMWFARRLNRPVEELGRWAAVTPVDAIARPPDPTGIGELDGLRQSLLESRARIEELLARERSFSSHVSHQLRTPIAAMRVAVESELEAPRPDPRDVLVEVVGQLDRLESTISSLLALARHADRPMVPCDVEALVRALADRWGPLVVGDRLLELDPAAAVARCDPSAVDHVLDVLVDNAVRHGQGPVVVRCAQRDGVVEIEVADAGPTPTESDVFADIDTDSTHGIGLRLARSLVEASGGELQLLDVPTTTFRLTLPADDQTTAVRR